MKKPSVTYQSFCALTAFVVLLSMSIPAGLHAGGLADLCTMEMMDYDAMSMPEADHNNRTANHETTHDASGTDTHTGAESCSLGFICCNTGATAAKANAVPSPSKISAGYIPVLIQILDFSTDPEYTNASEQIFASLYSPPLFLMNSSFLN